MNPKHFQKRLRPTKYHPPNSSLKPQNSAKVGRQYTGIKAEREFRTMRAMKPATYVLRNTPTVDNISMREMTSYFSGKRISKKRVKAIIRFIAENKITKARQFFEKLGFAFQDFTKTMNTLGIASAVEYQLGTASVEYTPRVNPNNVGVAGLDAKGRIIFSWTGRIDQYSDRKHRKG